MIMKSTRTIAALMLVSSVLLVSCKKPAPAGDTTEDNIAMNGTFMDLLKLGKDYTCTFDETDTNGNTSGTVYVQSGGKNMRGEFMMNGGAKGPMEANVIRKGNMNYVWTSEMQQGMMMEIDPNQPTLFGKMNDKNDISVKDGEPVDFDCKKWTPDADMFEPPSDIDFMDISAQMDAMMGNIKQANEMMHGEGMEGMDNMKCSACDQIPDAAAKAQCLQAMGC